VEEAGTLAALKAHREELIEPKFAEHKRRIFKLMVFSSSETRNASNIHCATSLGSQRTTPWIAAMGPLSMIARKTKI
jgi:hypothetical protein